MDEVSNPDHWATLHYGDRDWQDYDRMVAFSQANQIRLERTISILEDRRDQAETEGNWYEAAHIQQAIQEVQSLRNIA